MFKSINWTATKLIPFFLGLLSFGFAFAYPEYGVTIISGYFGVVVSLMTVKNVAQYKEKKINDKKE